MTEAIHIRPKRALKTLFRRARAELCEWSGLSRGQIRRLDGTCAAVLTYHRVLPRNVAEEWIVEPGMFVTPEAFGHHLDWLTESYSVLPLAEVVERIGKRRPLPPGAVAITFDDGWRDNFEYAFPQLRARSLPATVFLVSQRIGSRGAFWPDDVCRRMALVPTDRQRTLARQLGVEDLRDPTQGLLTLFKSVSDTERAHLHDELVASTPPPSTPERELLTWDEVEGAASTGIDFESHGATHVILNQANSDVIRRELESSLSTLRDHNLATHQLLAYPSGGYDASVMRIASELGYRAGFTTASGLVGCSSSPLALPRLGLHDDVSGTRAEFRRLVPGRAVVATEAH